MYKRIISYMLVFIILFTNLKTTYCEDAYENEPPIIENVRSWLLYDIDNDKIILHSDNIDTPYPIASVSKLMTFYIVMNMIKTGELHYDDEVVIEKSDTVPTGNRLGLREGEKYTLKRLLEIMMVNSCNDVTHAIARYAKGSEEEFIKFMNKTKERLGYNNAIFYNSHGLPLVPSFQQNTMSAREVLSLSKRIVEEFPEYKEFTTIPYIEYKDRNYYEKNTNPLIENYKEVDGLKTGTTRDAGCCFVCTFNSDEKKGETLKIRYISIVLGAKNNDARKLMSERLVNYALNNFEKRIFLDKNKNSLTEDLDMFKEEAAAYAPEESFIKTVYKNGKYKVVEKINDFESKNYKKGDVIGTYTVLENESPIFECDMILKNDLTLKNIFDKIQDFFYHIWGVEKEKKSLQKKEA